MATVSVQNIKKEFADKVLFSGVNFEINSGEHIGLIGANGTGKTTLFKMIIGEEEPDSGGIFIAHGTKIGYLEQHACAGSTLSVWDEALSVFDPIMKTEAELEEIAALLEAETGDRAALIDRQTRLNEDFTDNGGLTYKSRTRSALIGLGFSDGDFSLPCKNLSGGQRSKLSMCKLLLSGADLILLDEPTNHLDISATEWLEDFIESYKGTVIVISHDRYFLDKICTKIIELTNKTAYSAKGNYSDYLKSKQSRLEAEQSLYEKQLEEIEKLKKFVQRAEQASATNHSLKNMGLERKKRLEKKQAELIVPEQKAGKIHFSFTQKCETGKDVLTVTELSKSFGDKTLFSDVNLKIRKGDRIFILGPNGCGKTTFLRILTNQQKANAGSFSFGANVKTGYFDQSLENLTGGKTVLDEIWDEHKTFTETQVRNYLALFLFCGDDVFKNVDLLSGGEKAKLCILKLMLSGANVLLLDEPTNHLDIPSREVLENAISEFGGTVIAVSHDRFFINKLATGICLLTNGGISETDGDYDDYIAALNSAEVKNSAVQKAPPKVNEYKLRKERQSEINRLRGKITRAEAKFEEIDREIEELNALLSEPETTVDYQKVLEISEKIDVLTNSQDELLDYMEEWSKRLNELGEEE